MSAAEFWEDFYRTGEHWSGNPNQLLVDAVGDLTPGRALDLGCGPGGDALWLAQHGWRVTAVDIATAALAVGADRAAAAGISHRITWQHHDLGAAFPAGQFDLVACSYLHSPVTLDRASILRPAAAAVAAGGTLVVLSPAGPPSWPTDQHGHQQMPTTDDVLGDLALDESWHIDRCGIVEQPSRAPDGTPGTRADSVVRARRAPMRQQGDPTTRIQPT